MHIYKNKYLAGVCELEGVIRNTEEGRYLLCLGEDDAKYMLLYCRVIKNWRLKLLNDKWLNMNKELAYRKMLRYMNKDQIRNLG
jgi:hypothetical protein